MAEPADALRKLPCMPRRARRPHGALRGLRHAGAVSHGHSWRAQLDRGQAGLFDVSLMGQAALRGPDHETAARALESLVPADVVNLRPGQRYSQLLDGNAGVLDDLMISRPPTPEEAGFLYLVVNASTRRRISPVSARTCPPGSAWCAATTGRLALQGPSAGGVMRRLGGGAADLAFMTTGWFEVAGRRAAASPDRATRARTGSRSPSSRTRPFPSGGRSLQIRR